MREDIRKRREKYNVQSAAQKLFGGRDLIIERKTGMDIAVYRYMRAIQKKALKMLFRRPANPKISFLMRPAQPSLFLLKQVEIARAVKQGLFEEVKPVESWLVNVFSRIFNYIRKTFGLSHGVPELV